MRILIFTDGRGYQKDMFKTQPIFVDKIITFLKRKNHKAVVMTYPFYMEINN